MPPSPTPPQQQSSSNRTLWIILGSIGVVGVCSLICIAVSVIGALSILGAQTSAVFSEIERELESGQQFQLPTAQPVDLGAAIPVGTAQRVGDLEITVTDARIVDGENGIEPEEYYQFLALRLQIKNQGAQPVSLLHMGPLTWIQDSDDFTYDCCVYALGDPQLLAEELAAGASIEGELVYEAPDDGSTLFWIYQDSVSTDRIIVKLAELTAGTNVAGSHQ